MNNIDKKPIYNSMDKIIDEAEKDIAKDNVDKTIYNTAYSLSNNSLNSPLRGLSSKTMAKNVINGFEEVAKGVAKDVAKDVAKEVAREVFNKEIKKALIPIKEDIRILKEKVYQQWYYLKKGRGQVIKSKAIYAKQVASVKTLHESLKRMYGYFPKLRDNTRLVRLDQARMVKLMRMIDRFDGRTIKRKDSIE